jgi:L-asparagine permease
MTSTEYDTSALAHEEEGYAKGLEPRQLQMIAIAIGTGLFMGAGGRLNTVGPGLFIVYGVCGVFVFFILRALGELVLHRRHRDRSSPKHASSSARRRLTSRGGCTSSTGRARRSSTSPPSRWTCTTGRVRGDPQWTIALIAVVITLTVNMISVKVFGEMEFWAALIEVVALVTFLVVGTSSWPAGSPSKGSPPAYR